ncbi:MULTISPECIES: hypothetical protein [unclassified Devosia]|uniref:hypothetical protein n=1 Tax=unclassified Devosia TaxID=196773 RepID=UPI000ACEBD73|nr:MULTISPECIES: hypothetical protein [unclassified Devosia]
MRGFTEFAGRLTRLVYSRERGSFVSEVVPHPFEASEASPEPMSEHHAAASCPQHAAKLCPSKGGSNDR